MNNKRGMALVVALLTSFILLALVASLFWVIASTSRQAEYARNSAIALNLAEAGTADAIYRLNYCTGTDATADAYPFLGTYIPFDLTSSDTVPIADLTDLPPPRTSPNPYASYGIRRNLEGGYYSVGLLDTTSTDNLISVGVYKGVRRILTVPLRGDNDPAKARHPAIPPVTQGISEAFNKHVIYANRVNYFVPATVSGNIVYTDVGSTFPATGITKTKVDTDPKYFGIPIPTLSAPSGSMPTSIPFWVYNTDVDPALSSPLGGPTAVYTPATDTYAFPASANINQATYVAGNVDLSNANITVSGFLEAEKSITVNSASALINATLKAGTDLTINSMSNNSNMAWLAAGNNITITPSIPAGSDTTGADTIISASGLITLNGGTFRGPIISGSSIILNTGSYNINVSSQTNPAPILVYGAGAVSVTVSSSLTPTYNNTNNAQAAIIAYSTGGTANVFIGTGGAVTINDNSVPGRGRLIYSYGTGGGVITLNTTGIVYGSLVTNTVSFTSGTLTVLTYDNTFFVTPSTGNFSSDIYQGFSGGRRVYVPAWQGWRLR